MSLRRYVPLIAANIGSVFYLCYIFFIQLVVGSGTVTLHEPNLFLLLAETIALFVVGLIDLYVIIRLIFRSP